ncbi:ABC transporter substrate-binding protein [Maridesulfovibrio sp.]|uniref:ABC transporter substrate-binding protein n=1 Tax=Maridesulfovibrio sp. TaxID=2795000 RepID=UPI0029F58999|nr:ABC transporter substrate-binding protein [Maridesulfovibrio sp.]
MPRCTPQNEKKIVIILMIALLLFLSSCSDSPILIGFSGPLKGKYSDLGVQGRNGALMAIEDINAAGGVDGRMLELIVKDDQSTPEGAIKGDKELIDEGVSVIIGHMTSGQSLAALRALKDEKIVYLSPTVSTPLVHGIKDNFFRLMSTLTDLSQGLAEYSIDVLNNTRLAVVWDVTNMDFTQPYKNVFIKEFTARGGKLVGEVVIESKDKAVDWQEVVDELKFMNPDAVVMVTAARDLAGFAQYSKLNKADWSILSSMWGYTKELIQTGGKSVEGIVFVVHFAEDDLSEKYTEFRKRFIARFGWPPNFGAAFSYQAVKVFAEAVRLNGGKTEGIAEFLPGISFESSVIGPFTIDEFGDVKRKGHIVTVKDGDFVSISRRAP